MIPEQSERVDLAARDEQVLARARARAKSAWVSAQREDDLTRRAASEERLIAAWPRPRVLPVRSFVLGAAAAACVAALAFVSLRGGASSAAAPSGREGREGLAGASFAAAAIATTEPAIAVAPRSSDNLGTTTPPAALGPRAPRAVVFAGACPDCRVGGVAVEPGVPLALGRSVSVPRGARLTLGFALPGALMDPTSGADLEGPAAASAADDHTISLERGSARFRGLHDITLSVPGARIVGEGATFTVSIDSRGVSHIAVEKGRVVVTSLATDQTHTLEAGAALELTPPVEGAARREAVPLAPAATAGAAQSATPSTSASGRAVLHDGEKAAAPAEPDARSREWAARRAAFRLAEVEMANGERDKGRARLLELATCPDVKLAADASTLLARTEPTAAGRAETWARYLATSPPSGYRERALLERAEALFDAGRPQDGNAVLTELAVLPLSDAQKRQLERLLYKTRDRR